MGWRFGLSEECDRMNKSYGLDFEECVIEVSSKSIWLIWSRLCLRRAAAAAAHSGGHASKF